MSCWKSVASLVRVLLDGVRSAEPPISAGTRGSSASSALPEAARVGRPVGLGFEDRQVRVPAVGQGARPGVVPARGARGVGRLPGGEPRAPLVLVLARRSRGHPRVELVDLVGHVELRLERPAQVLLGQLHLVRAERLAVRARRVLLVGRAEADVGAHGDERRPVRLGLGRRQGGVDRLEVVAVVDVLHVPAVGLEAAAPVLGEGEVGAAVDADVVVVVEDDELAEAEVPGQRGRLAG